MAEERNNEERTSDGRYTVFGQQQQQPHLEQIYQAPSLEERLDRLCPSELLALSQTDWKKYLQKNQRPATDDQQEEFHQHYVTFVHHVDIHDVLDFMLQDSVISYEQQEEIFNQPSSQAAMRKLWSFTVQRDQGAYWSLARAFRLSFPDQQARRLELSSFSGLPQNLPGLLSSSHVSSEPQVRGAGPHLLHEEQTPMIPEDFIQDNYVGLINSFEAADLLPYLIHDGVVSDEQQQIILGQATKQNRMRKLLSLIVKKAELGSMSLCRSINVQSALKHQPGKVENLCDATEFCEKLRGLHRRKLQALMKQKLSRHDLKSYVKMTVFTKEHSLHGLRKGFRESVLENIKTFGKPIEPMNLFSSIDEERAPTKVLLMGAPGVGKSMTAYHFLSENTNHSLWDDHIHFVIFIILREMNNLTSKTSMQDLLFNMYGPTIENEKQTLKYLDKNQGKLLFILDGYDEVDGLGVNFKEEYINPFQKLDEKTKPQQLIYNLISGNILPEAKVLVTRRPHIIEQLGDLVDRQVELLGLDKESLNELTQKEISGDPDLAKGVVEYFDTHPSVVTLCSVPVNAKGFLECVKMNPQATIHKSLPKTKAALLFMIVINLLRRHDKNYSRKQGLYSSEILHERKDLVCALSKIAHEGLFGPKSIKQLFDSEDITKFEVSRDEVLGCGLMTGHLSAVKDFFGQIEKVLLQFDHHTLQEFLGALATSQLPQKDLESISQTQDGERDMILQFSLGAMGEPQCQGLLTTLYPDTPIDDYNQKAVGLLQAVWSSPRHYQEDGVLYSIHCISESRQFQMADTLAKKSLNACNALNLANTTITPADCSPVGNFLASVTGLCYDVALNGRLDAAGLRHIIKSGSFQGMTLVTNITAQILGVITEAINTNKTIKHLTLIHYESGTPLTGADWDEFRPEPNASLQCLWLDRVLDEHTVQAVCDKLHSLKALWALRLVDNRLPDITPLSTIPNTIKYLTLYQCGLDGYDISVIADIVLHNGLVWLSVADNAIGDTGAATLAQCMKDSRNVLQGLILHTCCITGSGVQLLCDSLVGNKHLKVLHLSHNEIGERIDAVERALCGSCIEDIYLHGCGISAEGGSPLLASLACNSMLTCLDLYSNALNTTNVAYCVKEMLTANHHLQALGLGRCEVTDETLGIITEGLMHSDSLSLLDLSDNSSLTCCSIVQLLTHTQLQALCVAGCELGREGWREVGHALCLNNHVRVCQIGDGKGTEEDLKGFMEELIHNSSPTQLKHLVLDANKHKMSVLICQLENTADIKVSCSEGVDTVWQLSGVMYRCMPPDLRHWYTGHYAGID